MSNPAFKVIQDRPLPSGLHTPHRPISLFCLPSTGSKKVPLHAFLQQHFPTLRIPVWQLPHQGLSHLHPLHSFPMPWNANRALLIPQLEDRCCNYCSRSWSAALAYPDTRMMVKQLLYPLHKNSTFCAPEDSQHTGLLVLLGTGFI